MPSKLSSPWLYKIAKDIESLKFNSVDLKPGWLIVGREAKDTFNCRSDLMKFAEAIKSQIKKIYNKFS